MAVSAAEILPPATHRPALRPRIATAVPLSKKAVRLKTGWSIVYEEKSLSPSSSSGKMIHPFSLTPQRVHTHYTIKGDAEFRPLEVFDDGRFTWIDMGHPQVLPAVFMIDAEGSRLVNYLLHSPYFVVQRLMPHFLLKLGGTEVEVINSDYSKSSGVQGEVPEQRP
ncbi:TrbG/VirB9 family P-type conjugative transfer protein [Ferrovum sp.]|uniref:TrbG/VirB9 family P-type conjugative transfer protein n=1 Tax=Ferrovum sp. TaxID=2609467 RepID=UPI0026286BC3|nr:TrbG/VirB9 family P-type conjugative transfer protein [Ferrovum sp.]